VRSTLEKSDPRSNKEIECYNEGSDDHLLVQEHINGELFVELAKCLRQSSRLASSIVSLWLLETLFGEKAFSPRQLQICFLPSIRTRAGRELWASCPSLVAFCVYVVSPIIERNRLLGKMQRQRHNSFSTKYITLVWNERSLRASFNSRTEEAHSHRALH
jgi:hypothetical protein